MDPQKKLLTLKLEFIFMFCEFLTEYDTVIDWIAKKLEIYI